MNPEDDAAAGGRAPRLLPTAGLEADRRDRRRARGQHRPRLRDPLRRRPDQRARPPTQTVDEVVPKTPGRRRAQAGRPIVAVDGQRYPDLDREGRARTVPRRGRHPRMRRQAERRLHRRDARRADDRTRRRGRDDLRPARIQRRARSGRWSASPSAANPNDIGAGEAPPSAPATSMWLVTTKTVTVFANIFDSEQRKEVSGVVGVSDVANETINEFGADRGAHPARRRQPLARA